ncbi:uncharacterized protein BDZ83DRAFT_646308 [Colletotrichum acutatum]|uniref:Uncharacterized protein n=1 Tax=Glomerella acutata TaxID=27357 RepID=A0AAD9D359_GLOAC|nr:uncharacterized protein BDZ83DRAFT_646308 [Colletotrichum acutatum]KAK1731349.1 hypothetical protein BDZ83DRAFT_646308 [Colletotrichum acutatum]
MRRTARLEASSGIHRLRLVRARLGKVICSWHQYQGIFLVLPRAASTRSPAPEMGRLSWSADFRLSVELKLVSCGYLPRFPVSPNGRCQAFSRKDCKAKPSKPSRVGGGAWGRGPQLRGRQLQLSHAYCSSCRVVQTPQLNLTCRQLGENQGDTRRVWLS